MDKGVTRAQCRNWCNKTMPTKKVREAAVSFDETDDGDAACTRVYEEGKETEAVALLVVGRLKDEAMD